MTHLPSTLSSHWGDIECLSRSCDLLRLCKHTIVDVADTKTERHEAAAQRVDVAIPLRKSVYLSFCHFKAI